MHLQAFADVGWVDAGTHHYIEVVWYRQSAGVHEVLVQHIGHSSTGSRCVVQERAFLILAFSLMFAPRARTRDPVPDFLYVWMGESLPMIGLILRAPAPSYPQQVRVQPKNVQQAHWKHCAHGMPLRTEGGTPAAISSEASVQE